MEIREATPSDISTIVKVGKYWHDIATYAEFQTYDEQALSEAIYEVIANGHGRMWVMWDDDKVVGMIMGHLAPNFFNSNQTMAVCAFVAVLPKYQRKKISKQLSMEFEEWGKGKGADTIVYSGYSKKFIDSMKRKGFKQVEVTLMKKVGDE